MRFYFVLLCFAMGSTVAPADAEVIVGPGGFQYCAPPVPPACVDASETYAKGEPLSVCKEDVQRYVQTVAAYRLCLARETERAVLQVNAALDRYKCRSSVKPVCRLGLKGVSKQACADSMAAQMARCP